ncbi:MAG: nickel-dependent hydrogenase large subunit [Nanoarchaeota archaeon]|nr:nickel-dependent hydrogenase large subunit [Nanoarchaeota archaeon]MBU1051898.1 nickel-dependent hydrogenase large subunit [Nanoarchaeota archaeon]MBU1988941.1 nickel-dependent hydrogenase large subunit [Nanoarchaeota archaeon]
MKTCDISIQNISKIEGHADLDVKVRDGKVEKVTLAFTDNKRFFTQAIRGQSVETLPQAVARICGTCSIAHTMCCIEAIERALGVEVSEQAKLLKKLTMYGMMIRDHALHIYLFTLPDVFGKDSVLDFEGDEAQYLKDSFDVKRAGNKLSTIVAGRAVHAPFPVVGGFANIPDVKELKALIPELKLAREKVMKVLGIYAKAKVNYVRETNFVALSGKEFNFLGDYILTSDGDKIEEKDYHAHLDKVVLPYSQAVGYEFEDDTYMLGALARLNLNKKLLHPNTKKDCAKYLQKFPSNNIFLNNLAQGIEIVHSIDHSIEIIQNLKLKPEEPPKLKYNDCTGVGVIEAPRGILYYLLDLKKDGTVKAGRIITPTQQNQINMELDIKQLVQQEFDKRVGGSGEVGRVDKGFGGRGRDRRVGKSFGGGLSREDKEAIQYEMEKLIRAYDPCISCAVHFLKVNWT